jgi:hypothetical protein
MTIHETLIHQFLSSLQIYYKPNLNTNVTTMQDGNITSPSLNYDRSRYSEQLQLLDRALTDIRKKMESRIAATESVCSPSSFSFVLNGMIISCLVFVTIEKFATAPHSSTL